MYQNESCWKSGRREVVPEFYRNKSLVHLKNEFDFLFLMKTLALKSKTISVYASVFGVLAKYFL